jgi:hypothetical protein
VDITDVGKSVYIPKTNSMNEIKRRSIHEDDKQA